MKTRIIIFVLTLLAVGGAWIAKSNYDGVCLSTGRRLTDRERLEAGFDHLRKQGLTASGQFRVIPGTDEPMSIGEHLESQEKHEVIGYSSLDEYMRLYPDCCEIKWLGDKEAPSWPEPTIWQRISGDYGFGVRMVVWERYRRPDGSRYVKRSVLHPYFTNCGTASPHFDHDG